LKLEQRPLKRGSAGCPETSVRNYHYSLKTTQKGGILKLQREKKRMGREREKHIY
jgi:hypothetical protein